MSGLLNDKERAYLKVVIKPFRERVESIYKGNIYLEDSAEEYIGICIKEQETKNIAWKTWGCDYEVSKRNV